MLCDLKIGFPAQCVRIDHRFNWENAKSNVNKMNNGLNQQRSLLEIAN